MTKRTVVDETPSRDGDRGLLGRGFLSGYRRLRPDFCRVCGHRAVEPVIVRMPLLSPCIVFTVALLYVIADLAHGGTIDGSPARAVLAALGIT